MLAFAVARMADAVATGPLRSGFLERFAVVVPLAVDSGFAVVALVLVFTQVEETGPPETTAAPVAANDRAEPKRPFGSYCRL